MYYSDALAILGFTTTLLFGAISIVFYLRSTKSRQFRLTFTHSNLQTRAHPDVSITFKGRSIANLARMNVVIWNSGTEPLRLSDFGENKYPRLLFEAGSVVLSVATVATSTRNSSLNIDDQDEHMIVLKFDYLNPNQGWWLEVLYDSPSLDTIPIELNAELIGESGGGWVYYMPPPLRFEVAVPLLSGLLSIGLAAMAIQGFQKDWRWAIAFCLLALLLAFYAVYEIRRIRRRREIARKPRFASAFPGTPTEIAEPD